MQGAKMAKRTYTCQDIDLPHTEMVALRNAGQLNLGIDNALASKISTSTIRSTKTSATAAYNFWNLIGFLVFAFSIYWSFVSAWWWFIPGFIAMYVFWRANHSANSENLLDAAMIDAAFYERVKAMGGWLYQIDDAKAGELRTRKQ
jgi:hypothetical protein